MNPLRPVFLTRRFWPLVGSAQKVVAELAVGLAERGCRPTVLTARWRSGWPQRIQYQGVPVIRLPHAPQGACARRRYMRSLGGWLQDNRDSYDLVYVSGLKEEAYVAVRSVGRKVPVVLRVASGGRYGDCLWQIDSRGGRRIKRLCLKADAFVGPSRLIERELQAAGYPRQRIHYLADGVAVAPPRSASTRSAARAVLAEANAAMEMPRWAPLAVSTGGLREHKGLKYLVAAWKPIVRRWPNARLYLAGEGPQRAEIERQIEAFDLTGRVVPVGVFDDVSELLAAADLFVLPSLSAGTWRAPMEAMAAGLAVVASDLPAYRELITDGRHGLLIPPADPNALSMAIGRLIDRPELADQLGAAARQHAAAEFSLAKMVDGHLTLLHGLSGSEPPATPDLISMQDES